MKPNLSSIQAFARSPLSAAPRSPLVSAPRLPVPADGSKTISVGFGFKSRAFSEWWQRIAKTYNVRERRARDESGLKHRFVASVGDPYRARTLFKRLKRFTDQSHRTGQDVFALTVTTIDVLKGALSIF